MKTTIFYLEQKITKWGRIALKAPRRLLEWLFGSGDQKLGGSALGSSFELLEGKNDVSGYEQRVPAEKLHANEPAPWADKGFSWVDGVDERKPFNEDDVRVWAEQKGLEFPRYVEYENPKYPTLKEVFANNDIAIQRELVEDLYHARDAGGDPIPDSSPAGAVSMPEQLEKQLQHIEAAAMPSISSVMPAGLVKQLQRHDAATWDRIREDSEKVAEQLAEAPAVEVDLYPTTIYGLEYRDRKMVASRAWQLRESEYAMEELLKVTVKTTARNKIKKTLLEVGAEKAVLQDWLISS